MFKKVLLTLIASMGMSFAVSADSSLSSGPNHEQRAPKLSSASAEEDKTVVKGSLKSVANTHFVIQFFINDESHSSDSGEGLVFLGQTTIKTDKHGKASFKATIPPTCKGSYISATATRLDNSKLTDTSEFSGTVKAR